MGSLIITIIFVIKISSVIATFQLLNNVGSFDNTRTDETLRNVFAKTSEKLKYQDKPEISKEEQAIELLRGLTPEQIMSIISAINK